MGRLYARLGLLVGIGFVALWAFWAITLLSFGRAGMAVATAATVALAAAALLRPIAGRPRPSRTGSARLWILVIVAEIVALNLLFMLIEARGWQQYRLPAIGLVIGLHFFPLGWATRFSGFRLLGIAMTGAAITAIAAITLGVDHQLAAGLDSLANALLLWTCVLLALLPRRP